MVGRAEGSVRRTWGKAALAQHLERRRGAILEQVSINVQEVLPILTLENPVPHPDFLEKGSRSSLDIRHHGVSMNGGVISSAQDKGYAPHPFRRVGMRCSDVPMESATRSGTPTWAQRRTPEGCTPPERFQAPAAHQRAAR